MPWNLFSQGINNLWMSGYASGYQYCGGSNTNFYSGFPDTNYVFRNMNFLDCNSNISDKNGNLLFYCNGIYIANANNDTMLNGDNLNPSSYTTSASIDGSRVKQGNLILPDPADSLNYYLFHETLFYDNSINDYRVSEIYFSTIDMRLDGGLGGVTQKNIILLSDTLTIGAITACKHANGRDWWIVFHKSKGKRIYKYLLTNTGLQGPFTQDIGYSIAPNDWIWQSCFSPDGRKFAYVMARDSMNILDFDRCTGMFSNEIILAINDSAVGRGVAFSTNSQVMYVSSMLYIYQYNLNSVNIDSTKTIIANFDGFADMTPPFYTTFYLSQLANDGKIYVNTGNSTSSLTVINDPDSLGLKCNILQHGFQLPTINAFTLPNFPNYFLGPEIGSACDTLPMSIFNSSDNNRILLNKFLPLCDTGIVSQMIKPSSSLKPLEHSFKDLIEQPTSELDLRGFNSSDQSTINTSVINPRSNLLQGTGILYGIRNYSRKFEFVKIDCNNDSLTILNLLPDYYYSFSFSASFDYYRNKYYYCTGQRMKVLDALTGTLDTTFDFSNIHPNFLLHTVFNAKDSCIYGIKSNLGTFVQSFCKFDPTTGILTDINPISPKIDSIEVGCKASIDPFLGEYYLQSKSITTIRISDGQVLNRFPLQNPLNEWIDHLAYSCNQRRLFALSNNYHTRENYFSEIGNSSGTNTHISSTPLPTNFFKQYHSGSTIDNTTGTYYYSTTEGRVYGVDINSGTLVYDHDYGPGFQLLLLESASDFDCTVLSINEDHEEDLILYPNPSSGKVFISDGLDHINSYNVEVTDISGRVIYYKKWISNSDLEIDLSTNSKGLYIYRIYTSNHCFAGKIILN